MVDGSRFDEFKPLYGTSLVTGWASIHGYPIGVLANHRGVLFSEEAHKATQFIQLANQIDVPLLFLQNTTGYMVGKEYEQHGIIKHGAHMINAVSNSSVPHLTVNIGASYGAGNYGMCGRAYDPRFLFAWPNARSAVMGPAQLAGVLSIVGRQSAAAKGVPFDEEADAAMRELVEAQIESESLPLFLTARLYDDGIIDPRDTRTVLGMCLSVIDNQPIEGTAWLRRVPDVGGRDRSRHRPRRHPRPYPAGRQPGGDRPAHLPHRPCHGHHLRGGPLGPRRREPPRPRRPTWPSGSRARPPPRPTSAPTCCSTPPPAPGPTPSTPGTGSSPSPATPPGR